VATNGTIPSDADPDVTLGYGYNYLGRLSTVTNVNDEPIGNSAVPATYSYDAAGNLAELDYDNGWQHIYTYNHPCRTLTQVRHL